MKRFFKEYFSFTRTERNGILVLCSIKVLLIISHQLSYLFENKGSIDFSEFEKEIDQFEASLKESKENKTYVYNSDNEEATCLDSINFFYFDPNKITETEWRKLGLSDKLIKTILNYTSKGGKFYEKEDLKKIYGMREDLFDTLKYYIRIDIPRNNKYNDYNKTSNYYDNNKYQNKSIETSNINLNTASEEELLKVSGIGGAYSKGIVKYRNLLGGYYSVEQLNEVYGMRPEIYEKIKDQFVIDETSIRKININKAEYKELIRHPYIDKSTTIAILNYRDKANIVYDINELLEKDILSKELYEKIRAYISVE